MEDEPGQTFRGVLKSFSPKDGYGFVRCPVLFDAFGRDVYIAAAQLPNGASAGSHMEFTIVISSKGLPQAQRVALLQTAAYDLAEAERSLNADFLQLVEVVHQYSIVIDKRKADFRLGIDVDTTHGTVLKVDAVTGGLVDEWNRHHPDVQVNAGDNIVEVNGVSGDAQAIFKECKFAKNLNMKICRGRLGAHVLPSLRVVSWNVLASAYTSMKMYPEVDPNVLTAARRRAQAKAVLAQLSADVVCLQEVDCDIEELGLIRPEYDYVSAQRPDARPDSCIIAWKRDKLDMSPRGHQMIFFDEHPPPDAFGCDQAHYETGNVGLAVELRVRSDPGSCITVATTHLCWQPHKMDVRQWHLHTFFNMVSSLAGPRILLCGDLNSQPGTTPYQFLAQGCGLRSAYADVEAAALTNTNAHACEGGFAGMLDYIWYSPKWFSVRQRIQLPTADTLRAHNGHAARGAAAPAISDGHDPALAAPAARNGRDRRGLAASAASNGHDPRALAAPAAHTGHDHRGLAAPAAHNSRDPGVLATPAAHNGEDHRSLAVSAAEPVPTLLSARWPSDHLALGAVLELTNPMVLDPEFD